MSDLGALPVRVFLLACLLAALVGIGIAYRSRGQWDVPGSREATYYAAVSGVIALLYGIRVAAADPGVMLFAMQAATPLLAAMPVLWVSFALAYAGRERLRTPDRMVALSAPAFAWTLFAWSSETHGLAREAFTPVTEGPFSLLATGFGPASVAFVLYACLLYLVGIGIVVDLYRRTGNRYRLQTLALLVGTLFPLAAGVITIADIGSYPTLEWTPVAFVVHTAFLYWAVFWFGTLDVAVVARDAAIEVVQDPVIVVGDDGRIRDHNPAAASVLGRGAVGEPIAEMLPAIAEKNEQPLSVNGREFDVSEDPITDQRGADRGHVLVLRDVTERERRERELQRREDELERQNERLEEFAGVVSHDLRNPLASATAAVELARQDEDAPEDPLERAAQAHERMDDLIDGLLSLATAGQSIEGTEAVHVGALSRRAWEGIPTANASIDVTDADCHVLADGDRFRQLLENLFRNAVEHGGEDVAITVTARVRDGTATVIVEDDGPGIAPEQREAVLEEGVSFGNGTGLGLAIVADIVETHGWSITIAESDSGGARFVISEVEPAP